MKTNIYKNIEWQDDSKIQNSSKGNPKQIVVIETRVVFIKCFDDHRGVHVDGYHHHNGQNVIDILHTVINKIFQV
jgi:hypothetical protein